MPRLGKKRKREDSDKPVLDDSSEFSDEDGSRSDSSADSSEEDLDVEIEKASETNPTKLIKNDSNGNTARKTGQSRGNKNQKKRGKSSESSSRKNSQKRITEFFNQEVSKEASETRSKNNNCKEQGEQANASSTSESDFSDADNNSGQTKAAYQRKPKRFKRVLVKKFNTPNPLSMRGKRVDPKVIEQGLQLLRKGFSSEYIGRKLNLPASTVGNWRQRLLTTKEREAILKIKSDVADHGLQQQEDATYSEETINKACDLLKQGVSSSNVMLEFGLSRETITEWKEKYIGKEAQNLSDEQIIKASELFKQGRTLQFVAQQLGVHKDALRHWKFKFDPESKEFHLINEIAYDKGTVIEVCRQLAQGISMKVVMKRTGIPYMTLSAWKAKYLRERQDATEGRWSKYIMFRACQQLQQGVSADTVAKELDVSVNLVRKWEAENVVKLRAELRDGRIYDEQFILGVLKRLKEGKSGNSLAIELGIGPMTVQRWKDRYFKEKNSEIKDGRKYKKETIIEACELLKKGERVLSVARKLQVHRDAVRDWRIKYVDKRDFESASANQFHYNTKRSIAICDEKMIQEGCKLLQQGHASKEIARKFKISITTVDKWKRFYIRNEYSEPRFAKKFDKKTIGKVCKRLMKGEKVMDLSKELGITWSTIYRWNNKYVLRKKIKSSLKAERDSKKDVNDVKLKSKAYVALTKDPRVEELCVKSKKLIDKVDINSLFNS